MPIRTRAAVVHTTGGPFVFEDVEIDDPRPDEVLVHIVASGICHTDLAARDGLFTMRLPGVFGHEGAGVVERVGTDVTRVRPGDKVVLSFSSCGECSQCRNGHPAHCSKMDDLNFDGLRLDGSPTIRDAKGAPMGGLFLGQSTFAFHALTRERSVIPVDVSGDDELALLAPLGCGIQTGAGTVFNELQPKPGQSLAVFGTGAVGLAAIMAGRLMGAHPIVAVDVVPSRLELARELGATIIINGRNEDVTTRLKQETGPIDHAVETTGRSGVIDAAMRSLAPRGTASMIGIEIDDPDGPITPRSPTPSQTVIYTIAGDSNPQKFIPFLIEQYREGKFPFTKLIRQYPASKINEAVQDSIKGATIKPVLRFA